MKAVLAIAQVLREACDAFDCQAVVQVSAVVGPIRADPLNLPELWRICLLERSFRELALRKIGRRRSRP